eukprot:snap_masked-scaffold_41-processed-gene-1.13-mRNA-1 protein AED:1.00 eAED:1.00 QI:0/-1/0/0/-1/1/1/0/645
MKKYNSIIAAIGLTSILVALGVLQCLSKDFMTVKLATNNDAGIDSDSKITKGIVISNIGMFESTYDPTTLNEDQSSITRLPGNKTTYPTIDSPFLFPGRNSFIKDMLHITSDELSIPSIIKEALAAAVGNQVEEIENLEFINCQQSVEESQGALSNYFSGFDFILPSLPFVTYSVLSLQLSFFQNITRAHNKISEQSSAPVAELYFSFFHQAAESGDCFDVLAKINGKTEREILSLTFSDDEFGCVEGFYSTFPATAPLATRGVHFSSSCGDAGLTLLQCFYVKYSGALSYVADESISDNAVFQFDNICEITGLCSTKVEYLIEIGNLLLLTGDESLFEYGNDILLLVNYMQNLVPYTDNSVDEIKIFELIEESAEEPLPTDLRDTYLPCVVARTALGQSSRSCRLSEFLVLTSDLIKDTEFDISPLVADLAELYDLCLEVTTNRSDCADVSATIYMNSVYANPIEIGNLFDLILIDGYETVSSFFLEECLEDEDDATRLESAQRLLIASVSFFGSAFLVGLLSFCVKKKKIIGFMVCGVFILIGGLLNLFAVLTFQATGFYSQVDEGADGFNQVFYESGSFELIGFCSFLFSLVAAGCWFRIVWKKDSEDEEIVETLEVKEMQTTEEVSVHDVANTQSKLKVTV